MAAFSFQSINSIHAEAITAGDMKHGPIALINPSVNISKPEQKEKATKSKRISFPMQKSDTSIFNHTEGHDE